MFQEQSCSLLNLLLPGSLPTSFLFQRSPMLPLLLQASAFGLLLMVLEETGCFPSHIHTHLLPSRLPNETQGKDFGASVELLRFY